MSLTNVLELEELIEITCPICSKSSDERGTGRCGNCRGTGHYETNSFKAIKHIGREAPECPSCEGTGVCIFCCGVGWISISM